MNRAPENPAPSRQGRGGESGGEGAGRDRRAGAARLGWAFLLTSAIVAAGLAAFGLVGLYGVTGFHPGRDGGFVLIAFLFCWAITLLAGVAVGIPVLAGLRWLTLDRRLGALLAAGLIAGVSVSMVLGIVIAGPALRGSAFVVALGAGAGLAAGALWWQFAVRFRSGNG